MANWKISDLDPIDPNETGQTEVSSGGQSWRGNLSAWVRGALLTGLSTATNSAIAATDSVLVALGKAQAQITDILASLNSHIGNTTNAHGMTTPGAAIVQAATVVDQRAALGLENHEKIVVTSGGRVTVGTVTDDGIALAQFGGGSSFAKENATLPALGTAFDFGIALTSGNGNWGCWIGNQNTTGNTWIQVGRKDSATAHQLLLQPVGGRLLVGPVTDDNTTLLQVGGGISHATDNAYSFGTAARRATTAYLATNPVIGSDSRLKTDIEEIPGAIAVEICNMATPVTYRYKVGGQEAYEEDEDYEERVPVTEPVEVPKTTVQIVDGKAVQVTTTETVQQPVYDEFPLVDGDGKPVMQLVTPAVMVAETGEEITPAVYAQAIHCEPRMTTVTKTRKVTKYREVEGKRYHAGYIAQEVKAALDAVADRWPPAADLAVWLLSDTSDADSTQMVRMEQMTPILHAAMRYQLAAA